jgi:hypothetical protein
MVLASFSAPVTDIFYLGQRIIIKVRKLKSISKLLAKKMKHFDLTLKQASLALE